MKKEDKKYNFKTHTYDSIKNGKLNKIESKKTDRLKQIAKNKNAKNIKNKQNNVLKQEMEAQDE